MRIKRAGKGERGSRFEGRRRQEQSSQRQKVASVREKRTAGSRTNGRVCRLLTTSGSATRWSSNATKRNVRKPPLDGA
jgi:hypothetical protein